MDSSPANCGLTLESLIATAPAGIHSAFSTPTAHAQAIYPGGRGGTQPPPVLG